MLAKKIKQWFISEKSLLKTREFWILLPIGILFIIGVTVPPYEILQLPLGILMAGAMPGIFALKFSVPFATIFIKFHMWKHKSHHYVRNDVNTEDPITWRFALRTTTYSFAIIYNILSWTGMEDIIFTNSNKLLLIAPIAVFSLFVAIITHVSIFLLTKSGLMYEDVNNGNRMNLGKELLTKLDWAISPIALISLGYSIWKNFSEPLTLGLIFSMIFIFIIILYSSFFSFYFLKRVHLNKLMKNLRENIDKHMKRI